MFIARTILFMLTVTMMYAQQSGQAAKDFRGKYWVYVGTAAYDGPPSTKLYVCSFDAKSGALKLEGVAAETENPGFLAVRPDQQFLYATSEVGEFQGQKTGGINAFRIDKATGKLHLLNKVPSFGANPAYITADRTGRFVVVASYYGGTMTVPVGADGSLGKPAAEVKESGVGVNPKRQESSHPHSAVLSPDNRFVVAVDLGLDKLFVYRFDQDTGSLTANAPAFAQAPSGSGPRHMAFSPDQQFAYVVNELDSTISAYQFEMRAGTLRLLQTISTLPTGFRSQNTAAEVQVAPSGRFVYVSNRGHDSIGIFSVDRQDGKLTLLQNVSTQGKTPRNFVIDPTGQFMLVANQDSGEIVGFRVDANTGRLTPTGTTISITAPVCIVFVAR